MNHPVKNLIFNSFVNRQNKPNSGSTSWTLDLQEIEDLLFESLADGSYSRGYRDGVLVVRLKESSGFYTGIATLVEGDTLIGRFRARTEGELPRKTISKLVGLGDPKPEAKSVDVILYSSQTLAEDQTNELPAIEGNWEVISINANPINGKVPIDPFTLIANHFHVPGSGDGGTSTKMSAEEFESALRESHEFWKDKAQISYKRKQSIIEKICHSIKGG